MCPQGPASGLDVGNSARYRKELQTRDRANFYGERTLKLYWLESQDFEENPSFPGTPAMYQAGSLDTRLAGTYTPSLALRGGCARRVGRK